jgi:hypothetical protein
MGAEEAAAPRPFRAHQPGEGADHDVLVPAHPLEQLDAMAIGLVLLTAAVLALDERARDRGHPAGPRNDLIENDRADPDAGAERLGLGHVAQVVVGTLVRHDREELVVIGLMEEPGGHVELAVAGVRRVDRRIVDDADLDLARRLRLVHGLQERNHRPLESLDLSRVDRLLVCRRGLAGGGRAGRLGRSAGGRARGFEGAAAQQGRGHECAAEYRPRAHHRSRLARAGRMASWPDCRVELT